MKAMLIKNTIIAIFILSVFAQDEPSTTTTDTFSVTTSTSTSDTPPSPGLPPKDQPSVSDAPAPPSGPPPDDPPHKDKPNTTEGEKKDSPPDGQPPNDKPNATEGEPKEVAECIKIPRNENGAPVSGDFNTTSGFSEDIGKMPLEQCSDAKCLEWYKNGNGKAKEKCDKENTPPNRVVVITTNDYKDSECPKGEIDKTCEVTCRCNAFCNECPKDN
jgi:hypothetical protein